GTLPIEAIASKLTEATSSGLEVAVEGASWVWPKTIDGLQAKDDVFVFATLPQDKPFKLSVGRRAVHVPQESIAKAAKPLVERSWAKAVIASLVAKREKADGPEAKEKVQDEIVELSVKHRVVSQFTSLLVLETFEDYARFGIDRKSLADILTVADNAIRVVQRPPESLTVPQPPAVREPSFLDRLAGGRKLAAKSAVRGAASSRGAAPRASQGAMASLNDAEMGASAGDMVGSVESAPSPAESQAFEPGGAGVEYDAAMRAPMAAADVSAGGGGGGSFGGGMSGMVMPSLAPSAPAAVSPAPPLPGEVARAEAEARSRMDFEERAGVRQERRSRMPPPFPGGSAGTGPSGTPVNAAPPYTGKFKDVMELIAAGKSDAGGKAGKLAKALTSARSWLEESPGDVMALVALGEAYEALGDHAGAARAYGSIIDLFPSRADLRRYAGARLERVSGGLALAADSFAKAAENRPDHPSSHRLLAYALLKQGKHRQAFEAMEKGLKQRYPDGRFRGVDRILREDLGLIAAAWIKAEPGRKAEITQRLAAAGGTREAEPSVRFVLNWETDANDVDFHIYDGRGGHAFYSQPRLESGGELYADVTTGYGPECFTIRGARASRAAPYTLQAHYYSRGPMGYGMGKLSVLEHDGQGGLSFEERPFVVMVDSAYVDLGKVRK
ncbi:MAG: tetratricopeptide repeat protein, partial [Elusimicrobiota bacterium]